MTAEPHFVFHLKHRVVADLSAMATVITGALVTWPKDWLSSASEQLGVEAMRRRAATRLAGLLAGMFAVAVLATAAPMAAFADTLNFNFTGADQQWTVPDGVTFIDVSAFGASGCCAHGPRGAGGSGDLQERLAAVSPGDVLRIRVGGQGGEPNVYDGGWNGGARGGHQGGPAGNDGGGGGGAADVYDTSNSTWLIVAGGGGGGGGDETGVYSGGRGGGGDGGEGQLASPCDASRGDNAAQGGHGGDRQDVLTGQRGLGGFGGEGENCHNLTDSQDTCHLDDPFLTCPVDGKSGTNLAGASGGTGGNAECCLGGGGGGGGGGYGGGGGGGAPDQDGGGGGGGGGGGSLGANSIGSNFGDGHILISYTAGTATTTTVSASQQSPSFGDSVSFTATASPVPDGGTVQFSIDGANYGGPVAVDPSTGKASSPAISALSAGSHTILARYGGDSRFAGSSGSLTIQVAPDQTQPTVTVTAPPPPPGHNGYFNSNDLASASGGIAVGVSATDVSGVVGLLCTDDGSALTVSNEAGSNPRTGTVSLTDTGTHAVACTAADGAGNIGNNGGQNTATVKIDATAPTLTVPAGPVIIDATSSSGAQLSTYAVSGSDPDSGDNPTIACTPAAPHQFSIGDTTVSCQATDRAGNTSATQPFTVHVRGAAEQVYDLNAAVQGVGPGRSLSAKAQSANNDLTKGDKAGACATLNDFIEEVGAQNGKKIPAAQADHLIADAGRIQAVIAC